MNSPSELSYVWAILESVYGLGRIDRLDYHYPLVNPDIQMWAKGLCGMPPEVYMRDDVPSWKQKELAELGWV